MEKLNLDVQETLMKATQNAIESPSQELENVLQCVIARKVKVGVIKDAPYKIKNYDVLLDLFMNEANLKRISDGRKEEEARIYADEIKASKDKHQIELHNQVTNGMLWCIYDKDKGYPFISNKVEDCFCDTIPEDGTYTAYYKDYGHFRGDLTSEVEVVVENGLVSIGDICKVFTNDFSEHDNHIFIETLEFEDGKISIHCGS